ncbi:MAG TPA: hypothetical protein VMC44_04875 [Geobacteraceae bacterium]|nr:hypothetical protein [Geobacteraceae bacterium]
MILNPAILALLIGSLLTSLMVLYASYYGISILRRWDIGSGSEIQLSLERRTYLISTILSYTLVFQLFSLFLFIYTADHLHTRFNGAMCAAGTLNADPFGYPLLVIKIANFVLAGLWLIVNHADSKGYDYPLIRAKYAFLLLLAPFIFLETFLQFEYFLGLHADLITSCCGSLFSLDRPGLSGDLAALPADRTEIAFYTGMAATFASGLYFHRRGRGGYLFSALSLITFLIAVASLISFICLYIYELPTHHCPFCILQKEYGYIGYLLYITLLGGAVAGVGTGVLLSFRNRTSLVRSIPAMQRRLTIVTLLLYLIFTLIVTYRMIFSSLRLR